ncbi:hypothetical protein LXL04_014062 [Taraxacum kok-saghyz]
MAVVFESALERVLGQLQKAVVTVEQNIHTARFKTLLKRLEITLKRIERVFYESWRLSTVLDRLEEETRIFILYLRNAIAIVLKCSNIKYRTVYRKNYSNKLIRLNNELLMFFQIEGQAKTVSSDMTNSIGIHGLAENSVVAFSAGGYSSTCSVYPGELFNLPLIGSFANLTSIRFEHVSFSSSIQRIFILPFLQKLSFVMCEIGEYTFKNGVTESSYIPSNLTDLEFDCCYDLRKLPSGLCNLLRLQNLSITNCHELDALPKRIGNLSNLEVLNLHCCTKLQALPESIGNLHNLSFLDISDCLSISLLPEQIAELCSLKVVKMSGVHGLQELPESMSKLTELEKVICDEETSYLWMDFEVDLYNLKINVVEEDRFENFMKIVQ